ncbi:MAG: hypothetical protein QM751_03645 [Paludibacteraceae bacterium]
MKTLKNIVYIMLCSLLFAGCEDVEFLNLKRDNPLDGKNNANMQGGVALKFESYSVYSDNNDDGIINKGETVQLKVCLANTGSSTAKAVKATFSTTSDYVSGVTPTSQVNYGEITGNSTKWADYQGNNGSYEGYAYYYTIKFTVSNSTPANTNIPINIDITDGNGYTFTSNFDVKVEGTDAQITYNEFSVYSDNNGDKIVNKGETVQLKVSLKNTGSSAAKAVKATFSTTSSYISDFTPTSQVNYGDIAAYGIKWADYQGNNGTYEGYAYYYTIKFTVSNTTPANTNIPVNISITDESGNTWTSNFNVKVEATNAQITYNEYSVYSDNDKIVNKGETVQLKVSLKNTGSGAAKAVKATFSTTSSYISGFTPTSQVNYGDIAAYGIKWADYQGNNGTYEGYAYYYTVKFTVSSSTPTNTQIPISISIVDESNNTWSSSFNVTVQ